MGRPARKRRSPLCERAVCRATAKRSWLCDNATEAGLESLPTQLLTSPQFRPVPTPSALHARVGSAGLVLT